ncbi:MAG: pyridoxamine 5'-phosphate oxidase [Bacteroidetes bacterium]|nr:pyridoxamine 5'-phosphate oxidase [Bacteroidota bacterium]
MNMSIADIRKDYTLKSLSENDVLHNPVQQFEIWWNEAVNSEIDEVNAMTLATVKANHSPVARMVLLKDFSTDGFTFFTNYLSAKGEQLFTNPNAAICFFWKELQRQVRIEGVVENVSEQVSDDYFNSRPIGSKLGAWASPQSKVVASRSILEENEKNYSKEFGNDIKRPAHWGGYILKPNYFEFWQGRSNRLHDRICYTLEKNEWLTARLAP